MESENIILRETDNLPLINKDDYLTNADFDGNFIKIYNDFIALSNVSDSTLIFNNSDTYILGSYSTYDNRLWVSVHASFIGVVPGTDTNYWVDAFPTVLAHEKNKDTILDEGGTNETTVAEIRSFIDAGLTSTTNLSITGQSGSSFKLESSTGTDVNFLGATKTAAGLLVSDDKAKLDNQSGVNTGDQTLAGLSGEDVTNKATDFTVINNVKYPTTQAVDTYLTAQVPPLVASSLSGVEIQTNKDATGGYAGLTLLKINFKNVANTFTSFFTNSNTASRTYTFQDRNGTISDDTDLATKQNLLVSGTNIKTVGGVNLLGGGDVPITISSGIWGVANSSGVYTYYATHASALAQAISISAKCIEVFADITISSGTSLILTNGININGNGHTINCTISTIDVFTDNNVACISTINNLNVIHTGTTNAGVTILNTSSDITFNGSITNLTEGSKVITSAGTFRNAIVKGSTCLFSLGVSSTFEKCTTYGVGGGTAVRMSNGGFVNNCVIYSSNSDVAVYAPSMMSNCIIKYSGSYSFAVQLQGSDRIVNCTIINTTGIGVYLGEASTMANCYVKSSVNVAVYNNTYVSTKDSVVDCTLISLTTGTIRGNSTSFTNCTMISFLAPVLNSTEIVYLYNCTLICNWDNAGGHTVGYLISGARFIDCIFRVTHASAVGFYAPSVNVGAGEYYYTGIKMNGSVNLKSPVGITNLITNTADAQGNIIIN